MNAINQTKWSTILVTLILSLTIASSAIAEVRYGETVLVEEGDVVDEDLYLFGATIQVDGTVNGDLVVAGGKVTVNGDVTGDVTSAAGETTISGAIGGSLRAVGGRLKIESSIADDVVAAGGNVRLEPPAEVGRDAVIAGSEVRIRAPIARDVTAASSRLLLGSIVGGDVDAAVEQLDVGSQAEVHGTLSYRSPAVARIAAGAEIGSVARTPIETGGPLTFFYRWIRAIIGLGALGLFLALVSPRFARAVPETLKKAPLKSLGWGALALLLAPIGAALLFFVGGVFGGWWLGLIVLAVLAVAIALAFPAIAYFCGLYLLSSFGSVTGRRRIVALLVGLATLTLIMRMPLLGALVAIATALIGLGALLVTGIDLRRHPPAPT